MKRDVPYRPPPPSGPRASRWARLRAWWRFDAWPAFKCRVGWHASYGTCEPWLHSFYYTCGRCGAVRRKDH